MKSLKISFTFFLSLLLLNVFSQPSVLEQRQIDSINKTNTTLNNEDTSLIKNYILLGEIWINSNLDSSIFYSQKATDILNEKNNINLITNFRLLITSLNNLGYAKYLLGNNEQAIELFNHGIQLAEKNNNIKEKAECYNNLGLVYNDNGFDSLALINYKKAYTIWLETKQENYAASALNNIGYIYKKRGNIERALSYYHESLIIREKIKDEKGTAILLSNLASIYRTQEDYNLALAYYEKSYNQFIKLNYKKGMLVALNGIGGIFITEKKYKEAIEKFRQSYFVAKEYSNKEGIAESLSSISNVYDLLNQYDSAMYYCQISLNLFTEIDDKRGIVSQTYSLAKIQFQQADINEAEKLALISFELAENLGYPQYIKSSAELLYKIYKSQNMSSNSLSYFEIYITMKDSLKNEETQKATFRQQTKYEFEKEQLIKEQQLKDEIRNQKLETERRNNLQYSIILVAILFVFGSVLALGKINVSPRFAEGLIFFAFLIFFEFCLVLLDPYVDQFSNGEPAYKLLFNALLAGGIFPLHAFFESTLKKKIIK